MAESLALKWGTIKRYSNLSEKSQEIVKRFYAAEGVPMSAMLDRPDKDRKAILCELIDQIDGDIYNDWDGKDMTKDEAKNYVQTYGE